MFAVLFKILLPLIEIAVAREMLLSRVDRKAAPDMETPARTLVASVGTC